MSRGIAVPIEHFDRFANLLSKEGVFDWTIWNIEDYFNRNTDMVEVEFDDDEEFLKAFNAYKSVTLH